MAYTYSKIATVTVGSGGVSSIDFLAIPQNYTDLLLKVSLRTNRSAVVDTAVVRYNASTSSLSQRSLYGSGSAATSYSSSTEQELTWTVGDTATASTFSNGEIYIPNYAGSNNKSASGDSVTENNATAAYVDLVAGLWSNTAAINQITLLPFVGTLFKQYSSATLYGIKAEV